MKFLPSHRFPQLFMFLLIMTFTGHLAGGEIKGKVVIKRPAPESPKIVSRSIIQKYVTKSVKGDANTHAKEEPPTVVVYIDNSQLSKNRTDNRVAVLDQTSEKFVPHVLPILVGTTVRFLNSDEVYHNVFSYSPTKSFDLGRYAKGKYRSVTFDKPGLVKIYCDIHTHMNAFILVLENPYFTTTDEEGHFEIKNIPPGTYTIKACYGRWPEKAKTVVVKKSGVTEVEFVLP